MFNQKTFNFLKLSQTFSHRKTKSAKLKKTAADFRFLNKFFVDKRALLRNKRLRQLLLRRRFPLKVFKNFKTKSLSLRLQPKPVFRPSVHSVFQFIHMLAAYRYFVSTRLSKNREKNFSFNFRE